MPTVQDRLQSIITKANATTGKADTNVTAATQSLVDGFGGGGDDALYYAMFMIQTFKSANFPEGEMVDINFQTAPYAFTECFNESNVSSVKMTAEKPNREGHSSTIDMFLRCKNLEEADVFNAVRRISNCSGMFRGCSALKRILGVCDLSGTQYTSGCLDGCNALEYVRYKPGCIENNYNVADCASLSIDSIASTINALAQVTQPKTLTLHPDVKAKLTPEQISTISAKNWTLA